MDEQRNVAPVFPEGFGEAVFAAFAPVIQDLTRSAEVAGRAMGRAIVELHRTGEATRRRARP